jgi:hypothetical protein
MRQSLFKASANIRIIYLLDGDQTGRATRAKLEKWSARAVWPIGTLAYVGARELIVQVGPFNRTKRQRARINRKWPLANVHIGTFPETLDVEELPFGSRRLLHVTVASGEQVTDLALAFVAGRISGFCSELADFRIVSSDKHAKAVCEFLRNMGFRSQAIKP